jgi:hypothetical protein
LSNGELIFGDVVGRNLPIRPLRLVTAREAGRDRARHHVADPDVVIAHFLHERFAECIQAGLRRAIRGALRERILPRQAADVDDEPAATRAQVRQGGMARVEHAGQIRLDQLGPLGGGHRRDVGERADAGVVDEKVEAAEARHSRLDRPLHLVVAPHVRLQRLDTARPGRFNLRPRCGEVRGAAARDSNLHSLGRQRTRNGQADAARSAGDQRHFPAY